MAPLQGMPAHIQTIHESKRCWGIIGFPVDIRPITSLVLLVQYDTHLVHP